MTIIVNRSLYYIKLIKKGILFTLNYYCIIIRYSSIVFNDVKYTCKYTIMFSFIKNK